MILSCIARGDTVTYAESRCQAAPSQSGLGSENQNEDLLFRRPRAPALTAASFGGPCRGSDGESRHPAAPQHVAPRAFDLFSLATRDRTSSIANAATSSSDADPCLSSLSGQPALLEVEKELTVTAVMRCLDQSMDVEVL